MAGVTDVPFRKLCTRMGAGMATSEMVTSQVSLWSSDKSRKRLEDGNDDNVPRSIQIAGSDPMQMAEAARFAVTAGAQIIDINMGCPAKKVCKKLAGSALLKDERLVESIIRAVVSSVDIPVTLKTRTGWDLNNRNGRDVARIAEDCGIAALTIHGRTRACRFNGNAEYDTIAEIVDSVEIPVIANGDIDTPLKARKVLEHTRAAGLMIGRAALGDPWIFARMYEFLATTNDDCQLTEDEITQTMEEHFRGLYLFYGEFKGTRIARKHFGWYCQKHRQDPSPLIKAFNKLETTQSQLDAVRNVFKRPSLYEEKVA